MTSEGGVSSPSGVSAAPLPLPGTGVVLPTELVAEARRREQHAATMEPTAAAREMMDRVCGYAGESSRPRLEEAVRSCAHFHGEQKRGSGAPYWTHPLAVAEILADLKLDVDSIVTALLHDVVEDTAATDAQIRESFGESVAQLVNGVTKLGRIELATQESEDAENFRKLMLAMSDDIRVLLVKLGDRMHNMRTLPGISSADRRRALAIETMEVYAPLAERIGLNRIRTELEELSFAEIQPEAVASLGGRLAAMRESGQTQVGRIIRELEDVLQDAGIRAQVNGRVKGIYSIWRKMRHRAIPFEELADIVAFRVIVDDSADCYPALGVLHGRYPIVPDRFKDYISLPKSNGYQSIHTQIIGPSRRRVEVQIRDRKMHEYAEFGVAAHWRYKDSPADGDYTGRRLAWVRDFLEILEEAQSPEEFLEHTKMEMYQDRVFCFTPRGKLIILPRGACAVDFAYAIHSEVGHRCTGARINGRLMPLRTLLVNGDQVEVLQSREAQPSPDWENLVVTAKARGAIRRYMRQARRGEFVRLGRALLERSFRQRGYAFNEAALEAVLGRWSLSDLDDLYAQVGEDRISPQMVRGAAYPEERPPAATAAEKVTAAVSRGRERERAREERSPLALRGLMPGMAVHFARCCHPIPNDRIVGIIVTGRGVTVHTLDCENLSAYHETPERWVELSWRDEIDADTVLASRLRVTVLNRPGGLGSLCTAIGGGQSNILNLKITGRSRDFFDVTVDVEVRDTDHLDAVIAALRGNADVCSVSRARG
ncbi:MAG: bifunctional (p)ppGpp synthetase/guanosine-3',5'-bis(diphosphate) 3'-pyrophosphohydrolase [Alphaproteobacteria bacterium]|nr:bifunctional (p)ppGpp synthetase/guanosine-3',5'-bis(diphosphate) 3'-pyrophosphohydrolase [Alphaproteobacteria bacterium]MDA7983193.1 bifunctional (p)ppGpp synthetase/guanosine-3',5'-bis(diphosphate) 3'-pyrophosphohydrolase [Alphaproteobacteria bacterium]MDA8002176.1 bifunctional (p)ppGpp synthetase/guanosine-3',5'-bis(diphosphate) 3'-pyrophosphohydrolase [Alphaproteobacteria bacterium]MDA8004829.1 bifunctional (p)ppGpp synthetase/guanosine-3',5'-bis(diphosphate) 3'-pyrophosphohydrolase [Alph